MRGHLKELSDFMDSGEFVSDALEKAHDHLWGLRHG